MVRLIIPASLALPILTLLLLAGCASGPRGSFCQVSEAHRFSDAAINAMSDAEVARELKHNRTGAALCGWRP